MLQVSTAHRTERFRGMIQRSLGGAEKWYQGGVLLGALSPSSASVFSPAAGCWLLAAGPVGGIFWF